MIVILLHILLYNVMLSLHHWVTQPEYCTIDGIVLSCTIQYDTVYTIQFVLYSTVLHYWIQYILSCTLCVLNLIESIIFYDTVLLKTSKWLLYCTFCVLDCMILYLYGIWRFPIAQYSFTITHEYVNYYLTKELLIGDCQVFQIIFDEYCRQHIYSR